MKTPFEKLFLTKKTTVVKEKIMLNPPTSEMMKSPSLSFKLIGKASNVPGRTIREP